MIENKQAPGLRSILRPNPVEDHPAWKLRRALPTRLDEGYTVHPKFTCEHCGERVFANLINEFPSLMECPKCSGLHDFDKSGGNYGLSRLLNGDTKYPDAATAFAAWRKMNNL